ncbi:MAG: beta-ketoacyl synthase N-terminal-like domain-containing protein, partial [Bacteroidales bacterium]|nr:beta-ketoacyl synthase N-terminal-like domain-containing protein [Bacteroidales bacterium]
MPASIFVTGSGIITGIGNGKENTLESLKKGISGVSFIKYLKNTQHTNIPVCEVKMTDEEMKNLLHIPKDTIMARTALMGIIAMNEAIKEAKFSEMKPKRIAFISGTTVGGMEKSEQFYMDFMDSENNDSNEYIGTHDCATCTNMIADYYGDFDLVTTISTTCSSA